MHLVPHHSNAAVQEVERASWDGMKHAIAAAKEEAAQARREANVETKRWVHIRMDGWGVAAFATNHWLHRLSARAFPLWPLMLSLLRM